MKLLSLFLFLGFYQTDFAQKNLSMSFKNDYKDVYHLSLIIYTPDGKSQTRVSTLQPGEIKSYEYPEGTELFILDRKQEAFAMKGNDVKAGGLKPNFTLKDSDSTVTIVLSSLAQKTGASKNVKPNK